jgi:hypothetical protein
MGDQLIRGSLPRQNITRREMQRRKRLYLMIPLFKKLKQDRQSPTYEKKKTFEIYAYFPLQE